MKKVIFFRNDDVRHLIENELRVFVDIFLTAGVPISLAVEPANVTREVVDWLNGLKEKHPDIIEIIQHGYDHNNRGLYAKGSEFGKDRNYENQLADLQKGKELMDKYFKNKWFSAMAFPYGSYNSEALKALDTLNYKVLTTGIDFSFKHRVKNRLGKITSKDFILNKKVTYHDQIRKNYNFLEIDTSVNIIKKYISTDEATHFSLSEIMDQVEDSFKYTNAVGILFHHRYHTNQFEMIAQFVKTLKGQGYQFSTFEKMYFDFKNRS